MNSKIVFVSIALSLVISMLAAGPADNLALKEPMTLTADKISFSCDNESAEIPEEIVISPPEQVGLDAVNAIIKTTAIAPNFTVARVNVGNASAFIYDEEGLRIIIYNEEWLAKAVEDSQTKWTVYAVLAHEIGHHLNHHTWPDGKSYADRPKEQNHKQELECDYFAGATLARLGATLDETTAIWRTKNPPDSHSHPPGWRRIETIGNGWSSVNEQGRAAIDLKKSVEPNPRLCRALPLFISFAEDDFLEIRGDLRESERRGEDSFTVHEALWKLPGSNDGFILQEGTEKSFYEALFMRSSNMNTAREFHETLLLQLRDCLGEGWRIEAKDTKHLLRNYDVTNPAKPSHPYFKVALDNRDDSYIVVLQLLQGEGPKKSGGRTEFVY